LNGYDYAVKKFVLEMENIAVWVAEGLISKDLLGEIIKSLIYEDDYNESLKLKIIFAISKEI
jgi:death-on-curing protein